MNNALNFMVLYLSALRSNSTKVTEKKSKPKGHLIKLDKCAENVFQEDLSWLKSYFAALKCIKPCFCAPPWLQLQTKSSVQFHFHGKTADLATLATERVFTIYV